MSHGLYNKGVIIQRIITNSVEILMITWGFDMTSAYWDFLSFYINELDPNYEWSHFNQPMSIRESGLDQPVLTWYPISVIKCVSNLYPGNLDNSIMENKQGEMCFFFSG